MHYHLFTDDADDVGRSNDVDDVGPHTHLLLDKYGDPIATTDTTQPPNNGHHTHSYLLNGQAKVSGVNQPTDSDARRVVREGFADSDPLISFRVAGPNGLTLYGLALSTAAAFFSVDSLDPRLALRFMGAVPESGTSVPEMFPDGIGWLGSGEWVGLFEARLLPEPEEPEPLGHLAHPALHRLIDVDGQTIGETATGSYQTIITACGLSSAEMPRGERVFQADTADLPHPDVTCTACRGRYGLIG